MTEYEYDIPLTENEYVNSKGDPILRKYPSQSGHRHARVWVDYAPDEVVTDDDGNPIDTSEITNDFPQVGDLLVKESSISIRTKSGWVKLS